MDSNLANDGAPNKPGCATQLPTSGSTQEKDKHLHLLAGTSGVLIQNAIFSSDQALIIRTGVTTVTSQSCLSSVQHARSSVLFHYLLVITDDVRIASLCRLLKPTSLLVL